MTDTTALTPPVLERVLARLGFGRAPEPTLEGLRRFYSAWCQQVPFDNVRKLIHVRSGSAGPLPGSTATDFLEGWLRFGTGGTCWANASALHATLKALGFEAERGIGTMLVVPDLPPNHGTVVAQCEGGLYLVDGGILHGEPLPLRNDSETSIPHAAWGVNCARRGGHWHIRWRPLHLPAGLECRLERIGASREDYSQFYDKTRGWSPFNYALYARINRGEQVLGVAYGNEVSFSSDGRVQVRPASPMERKRFLIERARMSEELVEQLPEDLPTPPPPGSRTAQAQAAAQAVAV